MGSAFGACDVDHRKLRVRVAEGGEEAVHAV